MIHKCTECGEEIIAWTEENFVEEVEKHYLLKHNLRKAVVFESTCKVKSSTMPHKGLGKTFKVIDK